MQIKSRLVPGSRRLAAIGVLSRAAQVRLRWLYYYEEHGRNAALTCRHFGISRQTFYRWKSRFDPRRITSLEERSRRPRQVRQPTWSQSLSRAEPAVLGPERELHRHGDRRRHPRYPHLRLGL
ncbi:MAG: helix-turn-helix domain-containing protein, partial [Chloroflexi bacterium]|nr:helix-turn-helix domain-containing protein [Chloroflexota bacterium]